MKVRLLLISLLALTRIAQANELLAPHGLLPTKIARQLLEQDPRVAAARAGLEVAQQEAIILEKSPYEWTPTIAGQRRAVEDELRYREWNAIVERTFRLPNKVSMDRKTGKAIIKVSEAQYTEALHAAAWELLTLWVDWLVAERALELATNNLRWVQESLLIVEKRVHAGDASKLDLSVVSAELAEQRRISNDAKTQASIAWLRLSTRFPGVNRERILLPSPQRISENATFWCDHILAESHELQLAQMQMQKAQSIANRACADKIPDPTFGIYAASEFGGSERISGIAISIPIPGGARNARSIKAIADVEVSRQEVELKKRQLEMEIVETVASAQGTYESLQIANEGAAAMEENARLLQRAYSLGEAELQLLLLARRQATIANGNALEAQAAALKSYYKLYLDAHLIWDLSEYATSAPLG